MTHLFDEHILFHTHIEKTAGSTLVRGLSRAFGKERIYDIRASHHPKPEYLDAEAKANIYVLTGHFHYGTQDKYFDRKKLYVACVRPPLDRFRSYYNYVRVRPAHPGYPRFAGKSFREAVQELLASEKPRVNVLARTLTGHAQPEPAHLLPAIEANYLIVSPHHKVNETLAALVGLFGGRQRARELYVNKGAETETEDIGELASEFDEKNALDNEVYRYVRERYESWLGELPERLKAGSLAAPA